MINPPMEFTDSGVELLKQLEGFKPKPYRDSAGRWTVGYGHLMVSGDGVAQGDVIDPVKGVELMKRDVQIAVDCVNNVVTSNLNQNEFNALVIFVYNIGVPAFQHSCSVLPLVNQNADIQTIEPHWMAWDKIHTPQGAFVELPGLKNRRTAEFTLFTTPA